MDLIIYLIYAFPILLIVSEFFRRYPTFALFVFIIVPLLLIPSWVSSGVEGWFPWVKGASIMLGVVVASLFRVTKLGDQRVGKFVVYLFFILNIFEAVLKDLSSGDLVNYLSAMTGILLIVTLGKADNIYKDRNGRYKDLRWKGMSLAWISGYTLWNLVFIYLNYTPSVIYHFVVLASAFIVAIVDRERWLEERVTILGIYFILSVPFLNLDSGLFKYQYDQSIALMFTTVVLGFMLIYTIWFSNTLYQTKNK